MVAGADTCGSSGTGTGGGAGRRYGLRRRLHRRRVRRIECRVRCRLGEPRGLGVGERLLDERRLHRFHRRGRGCAHELVEARDRLRRGRRDGLFRRGLRQRLERRLTDGLGSEQSLSAGALGRRTGLEARGSEIEVLVEHGLEHRRVVGHRRDRHRRHGHQAWLRLTLRLGHHHSDHRRCGYGRDGCGWRRRLQPRRLRRRALGSRGRGRRPRHVRGTEHDRGRGVLGVVSGRRSRQHRRLLLGQRGERRDRGDGGVRGSRMRHRRRGGLVDLRERLVRDEAAAERRRRRDGRDRRRHHGGPRKRHDGRDRRRGDDRRGSRGGRPRRGPGQEVLDLGDERFRLERLRERAVVARAGRALLVEGLEGSGEQENRDVRPRRVRLDLLADLVAVLLRHDDVAENDVGPDLGEPLEREAPVAHGDHVEVLVREGQLDDLLDRDAVVREQDLLGHPLFAFLPSQRGPQAASAPREPLGRRERVPREDRPFPLFRQRFRGRRHPQAAVEATPSMARMTSSVRAPGRNTSWTPSASARECPAPG